MNIHNNELAVLKWSPSEKLSLQFPEINQIRLYGTNEHPLFNARDVEKLLGLVRVHYSRDLLEHKDYVKLHAPNADGHNREQNAYTERGLYTMMFKSKTDIAEKFKTFTTSVLVELRLHGKVTTEDALKRMETYEEKLEQVTKELQKQSFLSDKYYMERHEIAEEMEALKMKNAYKGIVDKGSDGYKVQLFRERYFKKLYVYLEPRPRELVDELDDYDALDSDPSESDVRVYSLSIAERGTRIPVAEVYIPPKQTLKSLDEFIGKMFGVKTKKNRYMCSLEELHDVLDEFETME